jgi:hypothetical protein
VVGQRGQRPYGILTQPRSLLGGVNVGRRYFEYTRTWQPHRDRHLGAPVGGHVPKVDDVGPANALERHPHVPLPMRTVTPFGTVSGQRSCPWEARTRLSSGIIPSLTAIVR